MASGVAISNCFIHQNYENGITVECGSDPGRIVEGVTVTGNLIDRNTGGLSPGKGKQRSMTQKMQASCVRIIYG